MRTLCATRRELHLQGLCIAVGLIGVTGLLISAPVAYAEEAPSEERVEKVVVTATKRTEALQKVPFSVGSVDGKRAETQGASGLTMLQGRVAGLQILGIGEDAIQFSIRGVITDRQARTPQTAGLYLDEVPIGLAFANPNFQQIDVERIEVLRGPQGTLYGAGAEAGAIRIITRKPDLDKFSSRAGLELSNTDHGGTNGLSYAVVNAPVLDDQLGIRAVAYWRGWSGYIDNIALSDEGTNDRTIFGGRLAATYVPNDVLNLSIFAAYQDMDGSDTDYANFSLPRWQQRATVLQELYARNLVTSINLNYELPFASLTSITSYQDTDSFRLIDGTRFVVLLGAVPGQFPDASLPTYFFQNGFTHEMRLTSRDDSPIKWIIGAFLSDLEYGNTQTFVVPGFEAGVPTAPPASTFGLPTDSLGRFTQSFPTTQLAAFADVTLPLTSALNFSTGVRWYQYEQDGVVDYNGLLQGRHDRLASTAKASGINPRFNVSYQLSDDKLVYAQVARGFRNGGINEPVPTSICGPDLASIGLSAGPFSFDADHLWNYEVGAKTLWADGRYLLNLAAFHIDWSDVQAAKRLACGYAAVLNEGALTSEGFELETAAVLAPGLSVSGQLTYTDSSISRLSSTAAFGTAVGQAAPYQPEWAYNVIISYSHPLSDDSDVFAECEYGYTGERRTDFNPATAFVMPAFDNLNLRLGVKYGGWQAFAYAENLENSHDILDLSNRGNAFPRYVSATTLRPRTIGLRVAFATD